MIEPKQLLEVARLLSSPPTRGAPVQGKLRRAISSAYYALFHHLVQAATAEFVGANRKLPSFGIVYRSFEHAQMRKTCGQVLQPNLSPELKKAVGLAVFGPDLRRCATFFVELQQQRHEADYDPMVKISLSDTKSAVTKAASAIAAFDGAPANERRVFLTLLGFRLRS
jgi:hypothetical protein